MKKLFAWLTGSVIKEIGNAIDKISTSKEEKLIIKKQIQEILEQEEQRMETGDHNRYIIAIIDRLL